MSDLNQTALRGHALAVSKTYKRGRFTRVGQDFIDEVEADVEAAVRKIIIQSPASPDPLDPRSTQQLVLDDFLTPDLRKKLLGEFNRLVGRIIQNKIQAQPSVGCTAGRTR